MKFFNTPVPLVKMQQFHEILVACDGRYINNPVIIENTVVRVSYEFDDILNAVEFSKRWERSTKDIVEVRKDQFWRKLFRKLKLGFLT